MKRNSYITYPYIIWSAIFILIPILLILFFSFTQKINGEYIFYLGNYEKLFNPIYIKVFTRSISLSLISTIICLIIGYPVAYIISKAPLDKRSTLLLLFILPMWMNFLLRTYAWMAILGRNGLLNNILEFIGLAKINIMYTNSAVMLGMVYNFLPFMVLPIYTALSKMDNDLINAASDLGANKFQVFTKIIFPISIPGVVSGITMVFMPAVSTFVISRLLGGGQYMLLGNLIEQQFTSIGDWNFGSSISMLMMVIILISMALMSRFEDKSDKEGGGVIW
jgi:spermidine/putrescine transport system permease protein